MAITGNPEGVLGALKVRQCPPGDATSEPAMILKN
jgi:hypothetical protein